MVVSFKDRVQNHVFKGAHKSKADFVREMVGIIVSDTSGPVDGCTLRSIDGV